MLDEANKEGNERKTLKDLTPSFYQVLQWVKKACVDSVSSTTIKNCWRKTALLEAESAHAEANRLWRNCRLLHIGHAATG